MIIHDCIQGSPEWFALRAGLPTASEFSSLITSTGERSKSLPGYAITLAAEKYAGKPVDAFAGNAHTDRGTLLEPEAKSAYSFLHDCDIQSVGFVTDDSRRYGCSPDGFVGTDGMVEVKCLKAENHIKALLYFTKHNACPTDYVQQTQGQLFICARAWCDLVFYHPELPMVVIRQLSDANLAAALKEQIENVIVERERVYTTLMQFNKHREAA